MIVGFTGTQIGMTQIQKYKLHQLLSKITFNQIHHGDCKGADEEFHKLVPKYIKKNIHPPINDTKRAYCISDYEYPKKDYLIRNHDIVNCCDLLFAIPKESYEVLRSGTWSTIRYAKKKNKHICIIYPDGKIENINDKRVNKLF